MEHLESKYMNIHPKTDPRTIHLGEVKVETE